jgi:hypothetical protein
MGFLQDLVIIWLENDYCINGPGQLKYSMITCHPRIGTLIVTIKLDKFQTPKVSFS